jgi:hypothetical protein
MVVLWYLYPSMVFHDYSPTKAEATVFKACGELMVQRRLDHVHLPVVLVKGICVCYMRIYIRCLLNTCMSDLPRALINGLHYHYVCMRKAHPEAGKPHACRASYL